MKRIDVETEIQRKRVRAASLLAGVSATMSRHCRGLSSPRAVRTRAEQTSRFRSLRLPE